MPRSACLISNQCLRHFHKGTTQTDNFLHDLMVRLLLMARGTALASSCQEDDSSWTSNSLWHRQIWSRFFLLASRPHLSRVVKNSSRGLLMLCWIRVTMITKNVHYVRAQSARLPREVRFMVMVVVTRVIGAGLCDNTAFKCQA